ncbi:MAG: hypothetical protein M5U08_19300 [Burkholderiales bacterium]|nr:hypothetical protein [Burkholderiales bacterium]
MAQWLGQKKQNMGSFAFMFIAPDECCGEQASGARRSSCALLALRVAQPVATILGTIAPGECGGGDRFPENQTV